MKQRQEEQPNLRFKEYSSLPGWAHSLAAIGSDTEAVVYKCFEQQGIFRDAFAGYNADDLKSLAQALGKWKDHPASQMLEILIREAEGGRTLNIPALVRWTILHSDDYESVVDCMDLEPPSEVDITRVLSRAGSQKLVFEATWRLTQRRVVVKKLTGNPASIAAIIGHESYSHPLSMSHPNIIETHLLRNAKGEVFLVERWLPEVLYDAWPCSGVQQAANLLYGIADAVSFVHSQGKVHGDIKPDNIGKEDDRFILLDFGICRPAKEFTKDSTATGSLRTRAPELLLSDSYANDPTKVDIWALGATVFNFLVGRFPLIERDERIPRISQPEERQIFEIELARRVREEWQARVVFNQIPDPLRNILERVLMLEPEKRPAAKELKALVEKDLSVFIARESTSEPFAPIDELNQLLSYLPPADIVSLMPADEKTRFRNKIARLKATAGFDATQLQSIEKIESNLNV